MAVPRLAIGVFVVAITVVFLRDESPRKTHYHELFTEQACEGHIVLHPGNAYSSIVFALLAVWLARASVPKWHRARETDVVVLLWLSVVSFRFHATESLWIETQDLWCVIYLCVSCLSRYVRKCDASATGFTWAAAGPLLIDAAAQPLGRAVVEQHYLGIIGVLVYVLLWYSTRHWGQFAALLLAFIVKVADMVAASQGLYTNSPVNGTSLFHILTAIALYYHYRDEVIRDRLYEHPSEEVHCELQQEVTFRDVNGQHVALATCAPTSVPGEYHDGPQQGEAQ